VRSQTTLRSDLCQPANRAPSPRNGAGARSARAPAFTCDDGKALHSEIGAKLLTHLGANSRNFSECTLILQRNLSDFDSAMRRFESSRPSQYLTEKTLVPPGLLSRDFPNASAVLIPKICPVRIHRKPMAVMLPTRISWLDQCCIAYALIPDRSSWVKFLHERLVAESVKKACRCTNAARNRGELDQLHPNWTTSPVCRI
jgi:hypothetical protein